MKGPNLKSALFVSERLFKKTEHRKEDGKKLQEAVMD